MCSMAGRTSCQAGAAGVLLPLSRWPSNLNQFTPPALLMIEAEDFPAEPFRAGQAVLADLLAHGLAAGRTGPGGHFVWRVPGVLAGFLGGPISTLPVIRVKRACCLHREEHLDKPVAAPQGHAVGAGQSDSLPGELTI